jgi:hypothetical protein
MRSRINWLLDLRETNKLMPEPQRQEQFNEDRLQKQARPCRKQAGSPAIGNPCSTPPIVRT